MATQERNPVPSAPLADAKAPESSGDAAATSGALPSYLRDRYGWDPSAGAGRRSDGTVIAPRGSGVPLATPAEQAADAAVPAPRRSMSGPMLAAGTTLVLLLAAFGFSRLGGSGLGKSRPSAPSTTAPSGGLKPGLPDPSLTPGSWGNQAVADSAIGVDVARRICAAYKVNPQERVVLRLIPGALGGDSSDKNLFPVTPWFADLKGRLDKKLTGAVKSGALTKAEALEQLRGNWVMAMHKNYVRNYGHTDSRKAKEAEEKGAWKK